MAQSDLGQLNHQLPYGLQQREKETERELGETAAEQAAARDATAVSIVRGSVGFITSLDVKNWLKGRP